jgi:hypothetical protein
MSVRVLLVALALVVGTVGIMSATAAQAAEDSQETVVVDVSPQADDAGSDNGVWVQSWTLLAAAGAAAVGLLAFMVRAIMGWVKPPPPPEESH